MSESPRPGPIPLSAPEIRGNEWKYVKECLDSAWVSSSGAFVERFERALAQRLGARHGVAAASGTAALHLALVASGVAAGDEVVVSTLSFIAPANAVRYVGAWPVFVDAEPSYWQMDPSRLEHFLTRGCHFSGGALRNRETGRRVRAILPVHILGHPVDMDPVLQLGERHGLPVVEDATESLGALYKGRAVGRLGSVACLSFNGNKVITTGGGGAIVTDDDECAERVRYLSTQAKDDPIEYVHREVGYNYRLTNLQAALGCAQLELLDDYLAAKCRNAEAYTAQLEGIPGISVMREASWAHAVFWLFTILVEPSEYGCSSRELLALARERGIECRPLWQPLHRSPAHAGAQACGGAVAEQLNHRSLSLPSSVGLSESDRLRVIELLRESQRPALRAAR